MTSTGTFDGPLSGSNRPYTSQELNALVDAQRPIQPTGPALAFLVVSIISWILALIAIVLRVYARAFWKAHVVWGWDDTFAVLGMISFTVTFAFAIMASVFGLGMPEDEVTLPLALTAIELKKWWEISYCVAISFTHTSIGVAILRIAVQKNHRLACWILIVVSVTAYVAGIIWALSQCSKSGYPWNVLEATCTGDALIIPLAYCVMFISAVCDAGFALVPFLVVRNLQMPRKTKITLMIVMAMGSLAAIMSLTRLPWVKYMPTRLGAITPNVFMPLLSMLETMVGLVFGSLPAIGRMLRLYDRPSESKRTQQRSDTLGTFTFGGTPFAPPHKSATYSELDSLHLVPINVGLSQTRVWTETRIWSDAGGDPPKATYSSNRKSGTGC